MSIQVLPRGPNESASGRIGKAFGQGLSNQLPKEVERMRLSKGLESLNQQKGNLSPFERYSKLLAIPGITPQGIESGADLLKQEGMSQALIKKSQDENQPKPSPFPKREKSSGGKEAPTLTTREGVDATLGNYIPKTFEEIQTRAGELMEASPALYGNDPSKALDAAYKEDQSNSNINQAFQARRKNEQAVQDKITTGLTSQRESRNVKIPENVYQGIEDKAINAVKSKKDGGEGLTEQEASKKYGKELDAISREYQAIETTGAGRLFSRSPQGNKDALRATRLKFKERDDLENFSDMLEVNQLISPSKARYMTYPVTDSKELNNAVNKVPNIAPNKWPNPIYKPEEVEAKTLKEAARLAPIMKDTGGSPLSIGEELKARGYDPMVWMRYLDQNRDSLNLTITQDRELDKPRDFTPTINDLWMFTLSGLDELKDKL